MRSKPIFRIKPVLKQLTSVRYMANLLDNAIEAVEKLPEQTYPLKIRIQSIKKFVIIDISNPSREIKFTDDGLPRKTRKSSFHGWGLHNVAQAVEKYNGTIQFEYKDGIFTASAMLFFPQKPRTKETATKDR